MCNILIGKIYKFFCEISQIITKVAVSILQKLDIAPLEFFQFRAYLCACYTIQNTQISWWGKACFLFSQEDFIHYHLNSGCTIRVAKYHSSSHLFIIGCRKITFSTTSSCNFRKDIMCRPKPPSLLAKRTSCNSSNTTSSCTFRKDKYNVWANTFLIVSQENFAHVIQSNCRLHIQASQISLSGLLSDGRVVLSS